MPTANEASLVPPLSEVLHGFLRDRRIVNVNPCVNPPPVRMPRRDSGLVSRRRACLVRFHTLTTVCVIDPFRLRLPRAAPPGGEEGKLWLFNRITGQNLFL
jgi:hypothetical protein